YIIQSEELEIDDHLSYEEKPIKILDRQQKILRTKTITLVKVLWSHHGLEEAT
ncbi:OLC1v1030639C1, partial [Oldenlandia corymbosa var. corymbosa]